MIILGAEIGVSGSAASVMAVALVSPGKPETLGTTDPPPFTEVDTVTFVVEVEAAPVPESLGVILEVPIEAGYSGGEYGAGRSDIS